MVCSRILSTEPGAWAARHGEERGILGNAPGIPFLLQSGSPSWRAGAAAPRKCSQPPRARPVPSGPATIPHSPRPSATTEDPNTPLCSPLRSPGTHVLPPGPPSFTLTTPSPSAKGKCLTLHAVHRQRHTIPRVSPFASTRQLTGKTRKPSRDGPASPVLGQGSGTYVCEYLPALFPT